MMGAFMALKRHFSLLRLSQASQLPSRSISPSLRVSWSRNLLFSKNLRLLFDRSLMNSIRSRQRRQNLRQKHCPRMSLFGGGIFAA